MSPWSLGICDGHSSLFPDILLAHLGEKKKSIMTTVSSCPTTHTEHTHLPLQSCQYIKALKALHQPFITHTDSRHGHKASRWHCMTAGISGSKDNLTQMHIPAKYSGTSTFHARRCPLLNKYKLSSCTEFTEFYSWLYFNEQSLMTASVFTLITCSSEVWSLLHASKVKVI